MLTAENSDDKSNQEHSLNFKNSNLNPSDHSPNLQQDQEFLFQVLEETYQQIKIYQRVRTASKNLLYTAINNEASLAWSAIVTTYINIYSDKWGTWISIVLISFISIWACFMFYDVASALRTQAAERRVRGLANARTQLVTQGLDSVVDAVGFVLAVAWDRVIAEAVGLKADTEVKEKWYWRGMYAAVSSICWPFVVVLWNTCVPHLVSFTSEQGGTYSAASAERVKKMSTIWLSSGAWIVAFGWLRAFEDLSREIASTSTGETNDLIRQWVVAGGVFVFSLIFWAALRSANIPPLPSNFSMWRRLWQRQRGKCTLSRSSKSPLPSLRHSFLIQISKIIFIVLMRLQYGSLQKIL